MLKESKSFFSYLQDKAKWVRKETLRMHKLAPETRIASSLSCVEIFTVLYYGNILRFNSNNIRSEERDRLIVSKGHGSISLYPILAELGFFSEEELMRIGQEGSFLGAIPDTAIPGYETINGSLGHGLGVACGIALALKRKKYKQKVFVVAGDGELYEGSVWEAVMFAGHHQLDNLILIIDENKVCLLDYCSNVLDLQPLKDKFEVFQWKTASVDGHDVVKLTTTLRNLKNDSDILPKVLFADTKKGKGVPRLENDALSHIKSLSAEEIDKLISEL